MVQWPSNFKTTFDKTQRVGYVPMLYHRGYENSCIVCYTDGSYCEQKAGVGGFAENSDWSFSVPLVRMAIHTILTVHCWKQWCKFNAILSCAYKSTRNYSQFYAMNRCKILTQLDTSISCSFYHISFTIYTIWYKFYFSSVQAMNGAGIWHASLINFTRPIEHRKTSYRIYYLVNQILL